MVNSPRRNRARAKPSRGPLWRFSSTHRGEGIRVLTREYRLDLCIRSQPRLPGDLQPRVSRTLPGCALITPVLAVLSLSLHLALASLFLRLESRNRRGQLEYRRQTFGMPCSTCLELKPNIKGDLRIYTLPLKNCLKSSREGCAACTLLYVGVTQVQGLLGDSRIE